MSPYWIIISFSLVFNSSINSPAVFPPPFAPTSRMHNQERPKEITRKMKYTETGGDTQQHPFHGQFARRRA